MLDENKLNSVHIFAYPGSVYQVIDVFTMEYRGGWPRLVHLSADYDIDSGTTTMYPCGLNIII